MSRKHVNMNKHRSLSAWPCAWSSRDLVRDLSYLSFKKSENNDFFFSFFWEKKHVDMNQHRSLRVTLCVKVMWLCTWPFLSSVPEKLSRCFFSNFGEKKNVWRYSRTVAIARDLVRECHVTLYVTFPICCSRAAIAVIFSVFQFFSFKKTS